MAELAIGEPLSKLPPTLAIAISPLASMLPIDSTQSKRRGDDCGNQLVLDCVIDFCFNQNISKCRSSSSGNQRPMPLVGNGWHGGDDVLVVKRDGGWTGERVFSCKISCKCFLQKLFFLPTGAKISFCRKSCRISFAGKNSHLCHSRDILQIFLHNFLQKSVESTGLKIQGGAGRKISVGKKPFTMQMTSKCR